MKKFLLITAAFYFLLQLSSVLATELKTVTLTVDGMVCKMCPNTVKRAIKKLDGVNEVIAEYEGNEKGWAQVTFDSNKVNIIDITSATEAAGFPSSVKN